MGPPPCTLPYNFFFLQLNILIIVGTLIPEREIIGVLIIRFSGHQQLSVNLQERHSDGGGPIASLIIKSKKKKIEREKRIGVVRIAYLPQWGIFSTYRVRLTKSPHSFLG